LKIKAVAPWAGAKRALGPQIVATLGDHSCYVEPFCGSCSVLLAKPRARHELVNDLHGDLTNALRVIRDRHLVGELYARLHWTLFSEALYRESAAVMRTPLVRQGADVERAYHAFVFWWMGLSGVQGTTKTRTGFAVRYSDAGGSGGVRFASAVEAIPAWHARLRRVDVLNRDGLELLTRIKDKPRTAIYVDPPYFAKGFSYEHDFKPDDHARLAEVLRRYTTARVVLSYYADPRLAEFYPGWHVRTLDVHKFTVCMRGGKQGRVQAPEVLLSNLPFQDAAPAGNPAGMYE
jgi:DNA adenine methylase